MSINDKAVFPQLYTAPVSAGFPSTADDLVESPLDLNQYMVKHPAATYFVRARGNSMLQAGIQPGDILVVDRSITPYNGAVVVAYVDGGFTVKRLKIVGGSYQLLAENENFPSFQISGREGVEIWGVVTYSIRHLN